LTKTSTTSKPSTESDTDIKKHSAFRLGAPRSTDLPQLDALMDLYWGGPERRITGITVRIIGVNAIALIFLLIGVLYMGQYQRSLIEAKLETFQAEVELIAAAVAEGSIIAYEKPNISPFADDETVTELNEAQARRMIRRMSKNMKQRIYVFDEEGNLAADSQNLVGPDGTVYIDTLEPSKNEDYNTTVLRAMMRMIMNLLPERRLLPLYPQTDSQRIELYPDAKKAFGGQISISAWYDNDGDIFLTAAAPLYNGSKTLGVVLLTREGRDIEEDINDVWFNMLRVFGMTLVITILLSIYLSGVIARPLKKLANAAESVRRGQASYNQIPDLSHRHDEIGDLSIVLRDMTKALGERMDTIERFAADVAHELKNPLTSLRSAVETASVVKNDQDRQKLLDIIKHDVDRLDRLISDISSASRLDTELAREQFEKINLRILMARLLDAYQDPLKREQSKVQNISNAYVANGVNIVLQFETDEDIHIWGLESRIIQVFQNLLSNALSFSPKGSTIKIAIKPLKKRVSIMVEDQGPGIPENKLETIFERFYSERPQHEAYGIHSGLGLSICKQIMTAMGGRIFAANIKDETGIVTGARFTVILNMA
jgi:two-component system sensor histidine kinase ChvG